MLRTGARAVLASLWNVADTSTHALMGEFYRRVKAGRNKVQALKEVQLAMLRPQNPDGLRPALLDRSDWTHPFFWAPLVLIGEWR